MVERPGKGMRKPRADLLRNRERLMAAAVETFRAGGPDASLDAVARRAGLGIGTLYRHFPTREALFEAVYRREVEDLARLAERLAEDEEPVRALRRWLRAGVGLVATKRGMLTALALAVDKSSESYAASAASLPLSLGALLRRAADAGCIRDDVDAEDVLQVLVGLSMTGGGEGWETSVIRLLDVFVDGLLRP